MSYEAHCHASHHRPNKYLPLNKLQFWTQTLGTETLNNASTIRWKLTWINAPLPYTFSVFFLSFSILLLNDLILHASSLVVIQGFIIIYLYIFIFRNEARKTCNNNNSTSTSNSIETEFFSFFSYMICCIM